MPTISVIVPVYKVEKYLSRCVESILNQTYKDFELILVDDGSPDSCPDLCDEYAKKYCFIHIIHQKNGGLSAARNSGIEWVLTNSDSQWITFIDSDDWIHPEYLDSLLKANIDNNTKISVGQVFVTKEYTVNFSDEPKNHISLEKTENVFTDGAFDPNSSCARLFAKSLFKHIRFPNGKLHEDRFTTYKLYFQFKELSVVSYPLYYYFENGDGIVHANWNVRKLDNLEAAEKQIKFFSDMNNGEMLDYILRDYIHLLVYNLRCLKGKKKFEKYERDVRHRLKGVLKKYEKTLNMSFSKDFNTYKYAYPLKAKIYNRLRLTKK